MGMWTFAVRSCHIFGMGLVRMSVAAYLLIELDLDRLIVTGWMLAILLRKPNRGAILNTR
jgi:hypothetical protein